MSDSDEGLKAIPVAEFEGEFVRSFEGKLPAITLEMPEGYMRGMHLNLAAEVRVRNVGYNEDKRGDLTRHHELVLEEVKLTDAFDPAVRSTNVGGSSAGDAWLDELVSFLEGERDELNFDGEEIPERLRDMLKAYFEDQDAHQDARLKEEGRVLASQREDLIAAGADPADLAVPTYRGDDEVDF